MSRLRLCFMIVIPMTLLAAWLLEIPLENNTWQPPADKPWQRPPDYGRFEFIEDRTNYLLDTMVDPKTGTIPRNIRDQELAMAAKAPVRQRDLLAKQPFLVSAGPANVGGRTRAIAFDITDTSGNTLFAGGPNSGLFRSTNGGASWTKVSSPDEIHSVTAIAQDITDPNVWYYGTGEALGSASIGSFLAGDGIWKSTDGGLTWSQLAATKSEITHGFDFFFDVVHRMAVHPTTGDLYVAVHRSIWRSRDGGTSFEAVLNTTTPTTSRGGQTDIAISPNGQHIVAAFAGGATDGRDGVWTSESGNTGEWTRLAGGDMPGKPQGWPDQGAYERVVLAIEPTDQNLIYALLTNGHVNDCQPGTPQRSEASLWRYDIQLGFWTDLTPGIPAQGNCLAGNRPFAVQRGYDLAAAVAPDDPRIVFIGGTTLLRSTNGFQTTSGSSNVGGYQSSTNYSSYPNHHPDLHSINFNPYQPGVFYTGSDGGVHRADSLTGQVNYTALNNGYNTSQYYYVAIAPEAGDPRAMGGMQDNGTWLTRGGRNHENIFGGDGVSVAIARDPRNDGLDEEVLLFGFQRGPIFRFSSRTGFNDIRPNGTDSSLFVTLFHLDHDNNDLLYYADGARLFLNPNMYSATPFNWQELSGVSALLGNQAFLHSIATSFGPYSASSKLYLGSNTGRILRVDDPAGGDNSAPVDITPPQLIDNTTVVSLAVDPNDDRTLLAVVANYESPSIFFTENADSAQPDWQLIEGNLALPSIRSAIIARPGGERMLFVGTTVGLWSTNQPAGEGTVWQREAVNEMGSAVVADMDLRPADNTLVIGTHGNGMFRAKLAPTDHTQMVFPWVSNNRGAFESILVINNLNPSGVPIRLTATRTDGTTQTVSRTLPPNGFLEESADSLFPALGSGSGYTVAIEAPNNNLRGRWVTNNLTALSGESPSQGVGIVLPADDQQPEIRVGRSILFNLLPLTDGFTSAPVIVNTSNAPVNVNLRYVDTNGTVLAEDTLTNLPPMQPFAQVANLLLPEAEGDVALIAESDGGPLTGVSFVFNDLGETAIGNVTRVDNTTPSQRLMYPWVSNNEGAFASILVVNNLSQATQTVQLTARRTDGSSESVEQNIPPHGFLRQAASDLFPTLGNGTGYAVEVTSDSPSLLGGWITYNLAAASGQSPAVGVASSTTLSNDNIRVGENLLFGFLPRKGDFLSGPVITNIGDQATAITLRYYDANGSLIFVDDESLPTIEPGRPYPLVPNPRLGAFTDNFSLIASSDGQPITGVTFIFNGTFNEPAIGNATAVPPPQ